MQLGGGGWGRITYKLGLTHLLPPPPFRELDIKFIQNYLPNLNTQRKEPHFQMFPSFSCPVSKYLLYLEFNKTRHFMTLYAFRCFASSTLKHNCNICQEDI